MIVLRRKVNKVMGNRGGGDEAALFWVQGGEPARALNNAALHVSAQLCCS